MAKSSVSERDTWAPNAGCGKGEQEGRVQGSRGERRGREKIKSKRKKDGRKGTMKGERERHERTEEFGLPRVDPTRPQLPSQFCRPRLNLQNTTRRGLVLRGYRPPLCCPPHPPSGPFPILLRAFPLPLSLPLPTAPSPPLSRTNPHFFLLICSLSA